MDKISQDHQALGGEATPRLNFKISAIKKLLPYNGFYPNQRSVQIGKLFADSMFNFVSRPGRLLFSFVVKGNNNEKERQGEARQEKTRQDKPKARPDRKNRTRQDDRARKDKTKQDKTRQDKKRRDETRQDQSKKEQGKARQGKTRQEKTNPRQDQPPKLESKRGSKNELKKGPPLHAPPSPFAFPI